MEAERSVGRGEFDHDRVAAAGEREFDEVAREEAPPVLAALGDGLAVDPEAVASVSGNADAHGLGLEQFEAGGRKGDGALRRYKALAEVDVARLGVATELLPADGDDGARIDGVGTEALFGGSRTGQTIVA